MLCVFGSSENEVLKRNCKQRDTKVAWPLVASVYACSRCRFFGARANDEALQHLCCKVAVAQGTVVPAVE
jgi:hypothetical protein